jgi:hypothetical protein
MADVRASSSPFYLASCMQFLEGLVKISNTLSPELFSISERTRKCGLQPATISLKRLPPYAATSRASALLQRVVCDGAAYGGASGCAYGTNWRVLVATSGVQGS